MANPTNCIRSIQNLNNIGYDQPNLSQSPSLNYDNLMLVLGAQQQLERRPPQHHRIHYNLSQQLDQHQRNHHRHQHNNNNNNINTNHISTNGRRNHHAPKKELTDLVTCRLCKGYLIDAATLDLCMHSFCRACAIKYIKEKPKCPECNVEIKDKKSLNRLKTDVTMQNIVYKLVPGLYEREMARRRKFYADRPTVTPRYKSEMFGDIPASKTLKPDDMINVCIIWNNDCPSDETIKTYLHLRADSTLLLLKKLIIGKFGLQRPIKIYYGNSEIFFDLTTLMDIAATFNWAPENKIMNLSFKEEEEKKNHINSLPLMNFGHDL